MDQKPLSNVVKILYLYHELESEINELLYGPFRYNDMSFIIDFYM